MNTACFMLLKYNNCGGEIFILSQEMDSPKVDFDM